jgi:hypothetical protein
VTRRALGLAALMLLGACGGGATKPAPVAKAPTEDEEDAKLIAQTLARVAKLRGLAAKRPVPGVTLGRAALLANLKEHVEREVPKEAIERDGEFLKVLGLVPTRFDYLQTTMELLEAQLAGFYEPRDGKMYLAEDLDALNATATLAHELVHALQDQHYDLRPHSTYTKGQSDKQSAFSALAEGDATSSMMDFMMKKLGTSKTGLDVPDDELEEQITGGMEVGPSAKAPSIIRAQLGAPYIEGTRFVNDLRREGGWARVDEAWKRLPVTTEQILHTDKWRKAEPALAVPSPTAAALGPGLVLEDEDSSGELGMALMFAEWVGGPKGRQLAQGWGGDRSAIYRDETRIAVAMLVRYDADRAAQAQLAFATLAPALRKLGKGAAATKDFVCIERPELGPLALSYKGSDLVILAGPARRKGTWAQASTCDKSRAWAAEVTK